MLRRSSMLIMKRCRTSVNPPPSSAARRARDQPTTAATMVHAPHGSSIWPLSMSKNDLAIRPGTSSSSAFDIHIARLSA
jgi:hypothetical protein